MGTPVQRFGKYQVLRILGQGGMGHVYEALDPNLNRKIALKTMMQGLVNDPSLRARFLREAQAAGSLRHRNIVTVYDLGEDQGQPFIAMEFIEGTDLENVIQNRVSYPIEWKMRVIRQICEGLGHAHRNGIVHRDIKPANIRVTPEGEVKIMDFGIAHLQAPTQLTKGGLVLGTVHYMAPEQVEGGKVDHRVDIFAVGVIAYELLAYKRAFDGDSLTSVMFKIAHEDPDRSALPQTVYSPHLEQIVMKAMARSVEERYQTLEEMRDDLAILLNEAPQEGDARPDPTQVNRWVTEGERELAAGDPAKALEYAKRALTMAPADFAAQTLARKAEAEALGQRVERELAALRAEVAQARQAGRLHKALTLAQRLHELDPDDQEVERMMNEIRREITALEIEQLCGLALSYAAEGETGLALQIAVKIEKLDPKSAQYIELRRYLEEEAGRKAADALVSTAQEHLALGNIAEALAAIEEALHACPKHAVALEIKERALRVLAAQKRSTPPPPPPSTPGPRSLTTPQPTERPAPSPPVARAKSRPVASTTAQTPAASPRARVATKPPATPEAQRPSPVPAVAAPIQPATPAPITGTPPGTHWPKPTPSRLHGAASSSIRKEEARPPTSPPIARPVSLEAPLANVLDEPEPQTTLPTPTPQAASVPAPPRSAAQVVPQEPAPLTPLPEGDPTNPKAAELIEKSRWLLRDRKPREALRFVESAADIEPGHAGIQRLLVQTRIDARKAEIEELTTAALNHFVDNDHRKARKAVDKALALDPNNKKAKELLKILSALT